MTKPSEACGIVGIYAPRQEAARLSFFALYALQHRGLESAGICTADGRTLQNLTGIGLVTDVFHERDLSKLDGTMAIGHTLYSTSSTGRLENAQPVVVNSSLGSLALAHNGNLINIPELQEKIIDHGVTPRTGANSELVAHLIANAPGDNWLERMRHSLPRLAGAFCFVMLTRDRLYAARDARGIRPLALGRLANGWVVASESCALDTVGAQFVREIAPGELLAIDPNGVHSEQFAPPQQRAVCSFEFIYFARPDSLIDGQLVYATRERMGEALAREHPVDVDFVMPIPDSGTAAAVGFARASGLPYREGLVKNRYVGRTLLLPEQAQRELEVDCKFNPLPEVVRGQRVALIDDIIVRATTTFRVISTLRRAGAAEVHLRISAPPMRYACHFGVDTADDSLIANTHTIEEVRAAVGADSLGHLSLEGLVQAIGLDASQFCNACFHGRYPDMY